MIKNVWPIAWRAIHTYFFFSMYELFKLTAHENDNNHGSRVTLYDPSHLLKLSTKSKKIKKI